MHIAHEFATVGTNDLAAGCPVELLVDQVMAVADTLIERGATGNRDIGRRCDVCRTCGQWLLTLHRVCTILCIVDTKERQRVDCEWPKAAL